MRAEPEPKGEPPEGAPMFSLEQLDYLEKAFALTLSRNIPLTQDHLVEAACRHAEWAGSQNVIAHIRQLVKAA